MARTKMPSIDLVLVIAVMALAVGELVAAQAEGSASAPALAPAPSEDCTSTLLNLSPCLDYITLNDTNPPPKNCCEGLVQVVNENEICLCQLFGSSNPYGLAINQTRAAAMPALCKVSTPPLTLCNAVGVPVSGPASSAVSSPGGSFAGPAGNPPTTGAVSASTRTAGNVVLSVGLFAALILAELAQLAI